MVRLISVRLAQAVLLLLAVSAATFSIVELAPGDFLAEIRLDPRISEQTVERLRTQFGLDEPLPIRYGRWLASVGRGELGYSFAYGRPVGELIAPRLRNTLLLTGLATAIAWCLALVLGTVSAWRPDGILDRSTAFVTSGLLALPELPLAIFALGLAVQVPWLPVGGIRSFDATGSPLADLGRHLVLPTAVLVLSGLPLLVRHVRSAVAEALRQPHVEAARGHGLGGLRLFVGHVLPTAANPLLSLFGLSVGALVSGSLAVEVVMGWPGLGPLVLAAVLARDLHVVVAGALVSCSFLIVGNLLADLALRWLDPRLRDG